MNIYYFLLQVSSYEVVKLFTDRAKQLKPLNAVVVERYCRLQCMIELPSFSKIMICIFLEFTTEIVSYYSHLTTHGDLVLLSPVGYEE